VEVRATLESGRGPDCAEPLRSLPSEAGGYDSLLVSSNERVGSFSDPSPPIVPNDGVMPRPVSIAGAGVSAAMPADLPVRLVPVRAALDRVRDDAFRRVPLERLLVFLRPVERDAVFLRPVERDAVFFRPVERDAVFLRPVERDAVFFRPVERDAVFFRPVERDAVFFRPVERDAVFFRPVERDAVFLRAAVERVVVRRVPVERDAVLRRVVPPLERVLEAFLRALAIRAPPR
jgi:hypothetical protein